MEFRWDYVEYVKLKNETSISDGEMGGLSGNYDEGFEI